MEFLSDLFGAGGSATWPLLLAGCTVARRAWRILAGTSTPEERARKVTEQKRAIYSAPHEYAPVRVDDFRGIDAGYYDAAQRWLESVGFQCFGDVENLSLSAVYPNMRTAIRDFASADAIISASIWQVKMCGSLRVPAFFRLRKRDLRVVDFRTEFSDGTFLSTTNDREFDPSRAVPGIERIQLANITPVEDALAAHRRRVSDILTQQPGVAPVLMRTAKDVRSGFARAHAFKCEEYARHDFVDLPQSAALASEKSAFAESPEVRAMGQELAPIRDEIS